MYSRFEPAFIKNRTYGTYTSSAVKKKGLNPSQQCEKRETMAKKMIHQKSSCSDTCLCVVSVFVSFCTVVGFEMSYSFCITQKPLRLTAHGAFEDKIDH